MVKRYTPEIRISSHSGDHSEHKAICYQHPEGEYVKHEEYSRVLKELNNLKFGRTCISIAKKTDSVPKDIHEFAQSIINDYLSSNKNTEGLLSEKDIFYFKGKRISGKDIKKVLLKQ